MLEMYLRQPKFTYSARGSLTKKRANKKIQRNRKFKTYLSKRIR